MDVKEIRDELITRKSEEIRYLAAKLDKQQVHALFDMAVHDRDKYPDFYRETLGALAIKDLWVMCDMILGYNARNYGADMNRKLHGAICRQLDERPKDRMGWLVAREHLKTQVITVADSIRRIARDPNGRGVIVSGIRDNAIKMLGSVKQQWETNEILRWLYHYRLPNPKVHTWNEDALMFSGRTVVFREPCLEARGVNSELTSSHWSWGKLDDLVGRENAGTDEQLAKTIEWWQKAQPLFIPDADLDIVGTRYSDADLYGWLRDRKSPIAWLVVPCVKVDPETQEEIPVWPEYHSLASIERKKVDMGPHDFSCQMMCDPIPKGEEEFREDMFRLYDDDDKIDLSEVKHRSTPCDPAYTEKAKAAGNPDSSAVITGGWHPKLGLVVLDIDAGPVGVEKTINWMHKHQTAWGSKVGIEAQGALEDYLRLHNEKNRGRYLNWMKLKSNNRDKDSRIRTLIPLAAKQPIWLPKKNPYTKVLLGQLMRFPKSKKRDLMDCLAYLPQMVRAVKQGRTSEDLRFYDYMPDSDITGY